MTKGEESSKLVVRRGNMKPHSMKSQGNPRQLLFMIVVSFVSMYLLMYLMVDKLINVYPNLNQVYMAGAMTAAMVILEMILMGSMYEQRIKGLVMGVSMILLVVFIGGIRKQSLIGNQEFLRSMIPHHAAALLMCEETKATDPEIRALCQRIIANQQQEIDFMKEKLR